jgi:toxin YoeB
MSSRKRPVSYTLVVDPHFLDDLAWWVKTQPRIAKKVLELIEDIRSTPFSGLGKPEPLKFRQGDSWSRRITEEHRLVYRVAADCIYLLQCRYHYR